ncbi:MAG: tetratricopeptide repeat protein [Sulfuricaulis sp.]|uniref:tetratricopeptide repeat protein n=1 Tax=Sulfuricaulis sp. TaxID=2003553 RepID=UPI0034A1E486
MSQIKAFVGHSFPSDEDAVVRAFLKFLDQVKAMNIGFSWDHAEAAEPKELADKVMHLIEDKNLFIGICTNKELAVAPSKLERGFFNNKILKGDEAQFSAKTSDWIIQEIGLAIGCKMELILLVEEGVRQPGGLQGNIEYITFDRSAPEKSFVKLLEMIQALRPKARVLTVEETQTTAAPPSETQEAKKVGDEWLKPKPEWKRRNYEFALMSMIADENEQGAKSISDVYMATPDGQKAKNRESWEAFCEYMRLTFGKGGDLAKLQRLVKAYPDNSGVQKYLAKAYLEYQDFEKAADHFEVAAEKSVDAKSQLTRYGEAAVAYFRAGLQQETKAIFGKMRDLVPKVDDGESVFIKSLRNVAEHANDKDLLLGLMERLIHLHPEDTNSRFSLAYKYSEVGYRDVSLLHYLKIPYQERGAATWNNLGVEFDHFDLHSKSVKAYRKAEELGKTLAMSNLAHKFIKEGFLEEAENICNNAVKIKDYHKNIGYAISRIKDVPEEEEKKENETVAKGAPLSEFYREFGLAASKNDVPNIAGTWDSERCPLKLEIKDGKLVAEGSYERETLANIFALGLGGGGTTTPPKGTKYSVRYEGIVGGYTIKGSISIEEVGKPARTRSLLEIAGNSKEVLMIVSDNLKEIRVWEKGAADTERFYALTHKL